MRIERSLGIQLHPTSLPGGRLGPEAFAFVDWLAAAGARWWQILPLNPPDEFGSPYASPSAFAAWPALLCEPDNAVPRSEAQAFSTRHAGWIEDWVAFAGGDALADQVRFDREWRALREYALRRGVRIIGDIPIYVAKDGCDHLGHPALFQPVDQVVAGAPPDDLSDDGQLWGNPLYDWAANAAEEYHWWIGRMRRALELTDMFRIDHFRGFAGYWTVPAKDDTARNGHWEPGPGAALFRAAEAELGPLPVIAEDLGVITPDVEELRDELGYPGMAIVLWSFDAPRTSPHRLENHRENQVVYTTTHDMDTLAGALPDEPTWPIVELTLSSRSALAILPVQDVLGLGSDARMNHPGEYGDHNWSWRLEPGQLSLADASRLRAAAERSGRA